MRSSPVLPPLPALRAFEAVGRLLSFRRAGEELLITQSAVSHHIRQLENALGVPLFIRKPRSIALTPEGLRYLDVTMRAFGLIAEATGDLRAQGGQGSVRVSLLPSFAANWLVARLSGFQKSHPGIRLDLDPTLRLVDLAANEADLAIRYGDGSWDNVEARLLMAESVTPVASPALLRGQRALASPRDLLEHTLLLTRNPVDWEVWVESVGLDISRATTLQLTDYNVAIQAAIDGQGIAMGRALLLRDHVASGRLAQPFAHMASSAKVGHWLLAPRRRLSPAATAFADWLMAQAAAQHAADDFRQGGALR
jgi:LysR family glycine cleavage system transcriptional activator